MFAQVRKKGSGPFILVFLILTSLLGYGQEPCSPISTLDCDGLAMTLPINLDFTTAGTGLSGSGFTMVMEPSARLLADGPAFNTNVPGYEPSLITQGASGLILTSTKGLFYSQLASQGTPNSTDTNSQINALGSGFNTPNRIFDITAQLLMPDFTASAGNNSQQAGIWFGLDEDHYAKLVLLKSNGTRKLQLQVENMDQSTTALAFLELNTADISANVGDLVALRMELDPVNGKVKGYYMLNGGNEVAVTDATTGSDFLEIPASYFAGTTLEENLPKSLDFAGIFTSQRRAAADQTINVIFKDFSIVPSPQPVTVTAPFRMNVAGGEYDKAGELYSAEDVLYLQETQPTTVSTTAYTPYVVEGGYQDLYFPRRYGPEFSYNFPIANGNYTVRLHMLENYQDEPDARVFDVSMEGALKVDDLDLFATYGKGALALLSYDVQVTDGELNIDFLASINNAIVQAIEILPVTASSENNILSFAFAEAEAPATIDAGTSTITAEVPNNTDLTALAPAITISEGAAISPESGDAADFTASVDYTVTAEDGSKRVYTVFVTKAPAITCSPISTLDCNEVVANLPINLDFSAAAPNTLEDANGSGTGFTAVLEHSEARRTGDLPISNPQVNGYEPSLLNLSGGTLQIKSQGGINYLDPSGSSNNNNQVNTLGVGLQNLVKPISIETKLLAISTGSGSAQAGIWFGFDEDNFVKLNINADNIELRREVDAKSSNSDDTEDQIQLDDVGVAGQNVSLKMVIDPVKQVITGYYAVNDGPYVKLTKTGLSELALPSSYLVGRDLNTENTGVSFAGIYDTHRNGVQFTADFDSFSIVQENEEKALSFNLESLDFNGEEGAIIATQTVTLSATSGNPTVTLSEDSDASTWLILPEGPSLGNLEFGIKPGLAAGTYSTVVFASDSEEAYTNAQLNINLEITPASSAKSIEAFTVAAATGDAVISSADHTVSIEVANGTDLTALSPTILISEGATIDPASESAQDFTFPVAYTVTAEDTTTQIWTVTITEAAQPFAAQINFQDNASVPPAGYLKDYGKEFGFSSLVIGDKTFKYGWKLLANGTPFDASNEAANNSTGVGRNRLGVTGYANASVQEKLEGTLVHFQGNTILSDALQLAWEGQPRGNELFWEMEIPNGVYDITVSLGDAGTDIDSRHSATVEGYTVVPAFVPSLGEKRSATITVAVTDGFLTINGLGGFNSKINYINVAQSTGTPVSGQLAFNPASLSQLLAPDATGTLTATIDGEGAGPIGLVIANNLTHRTDKDATGTTDWLTIPATGSLGEQNFAINATGLADGASRNNTIIASAKGFKPAVLDASLRVSDEAPGLLLFSPETVSVDTPAGTTKTFKVNLNNSDEDPLTVNLLANENGTVPDWLTYNGQVLSEANQVKYNLGDGSNEVVFGIDATSLNTGTYTAHVTAELNGYETGVLDITLEVLDANEALRPYVTAVRPEDGAVNVSLTESISVDLQFPSGESFDGATVNPGSVKLYDLTGGNRIAVEDATVNGSGGGDAITLSASLKENTTYEFEITDQVKDANGYALVPFTSRFTTTSSGNDTPTNLSGVSFTQQILVDQDFGPDGFTSLVVGPDHRLYGATSGGKIERWDIANDGTLDNHITISPFGVQRRLLIGFKFAQDATGQNLMAWIGHSNGAFENVPDWSGKISKIDLNDPQNPILTDYVVNLPRSYRDHSTNSFDFGPDGALYFPQGSNSAMGAPDNSWGNREEHLLTAAILRLDIGKAEAAGLPLDVKTEDGGTYDPYAANAPLTIYASGTRNAFDLVWHSNGQLYVPTNGSAAGGNTPSLETGATLSDGSTYTGPRIPGLINVRDTQNDYLFRVIKGKYYGNPNPTRHQYILNGGNPTPGEDPGEVVWNNGQAGYPVGTQPDPNYGGWAYDFGLNKSPNGAIEYRSNAFGGKLQGKILVCRFSGGDDIIVLEPGKTNLDIIQATEGSEVPGLRRPFSNPLDVTEDPLNGNLYISEYFDGNGDGKPRITLLKADVPAQLGARIAFNVEKVTGDALTAGNDIFTKVVEITNEGDETLTGITAEITGANAGEFSFSGVPTSLAAGAKSTFSVVFDPSANGVRTALLSISGTDTPVKTLSLNGLGRAGSGGTNEPSLQAVLDTYFGAGKIATADTDPSSNQLNLPAGKSYNDLLGDELDIKRFEKVSNSPVTVEVLSIFGPEDNDPVTAFGWYKSGDASSATEIFTVSNSIPSNGQTLNPVTEGNLEFDPGNTTFGFYSRWPYFNNRRLFSEDALNTFSQAIPHHVRVYAVPDEVNAYVVATEEHISGFDYQDVVVIVRNVQPASVAGAGCNPISTLACDALEVPLPFALDFTGSEGGLAQTGFTMVDRPSARLAVDGPVSNPDVAGFEPGRISFANGKMILNAANGIAYIKNGTGTGTSTNVNSQINTLGVGINADNQGNFSIKTTVLYPYSDNTENSEQAGLWFGLNEDNYVKLVAINASNVQLLTEVNAISDNDDQSIIAENIANLNTSAVTLRLYVDLDNNLLTGYYSLNGSSEVEVGSLPLPNSFITGNPSFSDLSFAGVFATKRKELNANVNYTFEDFGIIPDNAPVTTESININFSDPLTEAPANYARDAGEPYGERTDGNTYGWLDAQTGAPADLTTSGRNRAIAGVDVLGNTLIHMQYGNVSTDASKGYLPDAKWEIDLPQGVYSVMVTVGDPTIDGSPEDTPKHSINAEGVNLVDQFVPTGAEGASTRFQTASGEVSVTDGRLTIDAIGGFNTKISSLTIKPVSGDANKAYFVNVTPKNNATGVRLNDFQANVELVVPDGYELDKTTLAGHVNLYEVTPQGEVLVPSNSNDTGGGDAITLTAKNGVKEFTTYIFRLTGDIDANRIGDLSDRIPFQAFESRFTTGGEDDIPPPVRDLTGVEFSQIKGASLGEHTTNELFSSLTIGPDGKLYASTLGDFNSDGKIQRWDIAPDGTLTNLQVLTPELTGANDPATGQSRDNQNRLIIGLTFDPSSTADNLIAYVTHSKAAVTNGPEWDGKLTRLSGPDLGEVQDLLIHLPRSAKDHLTNSIAFDPSGNMYINQGSNTAGGKPDPAWNFRTERLLSGAVLKVELNKLPANLPLDVYTTDNISVINSAPSGSITMSDGTYNPYATNSPVTIFATGIRNAYDLVWHSNGWLYVPTNGTAGNNTNSPNTPSTSDYPLARRIDGRTDIGSITGINGGETQKDWLFKTKGGSYHGHPNPYRGEYVLNHGGKPYSGLPGQSESSYRDVAKYPTTLGPDPNYREPAYDFGKNKSPNGVIEYKSDAFGGKLKGLLMVVRFSGQDDLLVMDPNNNGDIAEVYNNIPGLGGFDDPLDVVEDTKTGNLYISEYDRDNDGLPQLTLLRAADPAATPVAISANPGELIFEATSNTNENEGEQTDTKIVEVTNTSTSVLKITGAAITGAYADQFEAVSPSGAITINPGKSVNYTVTYAPDVNNDNLGYQDAVLTITSNAVDKPTFKIRLNALKKSGFEGGEEPWLQSVVDALGIGINVGWNSLANGVDPNPVGDELEVERWVKLSADLPVTLTPVGRYSPAEALPFGWYTRNENINTNQVGVLKSDLASAQTLFPPMENGEQSASFDPKGSIFGIFVESKSFGRFNYTEDAINTDGVLHRTRIYPNRDRKGNDIPNSYLIAFEDASNGDYQDYIFIISNVVPAEDAMLTFNFDPKSLDFEASVDQQNIAAQQVTINASGGVTPGEATLSASQSWVVLPDTYTFGSPLDIKVNAQGLGVGIHEATITIKAPNYTSSELNVRFRISNELNYVYQFNFQSPDDIEVSPEGYIDDIGKPFGAQNTALGDIEYGWVLPKTNTPADAGVNARNRNDGNADDALLKTFTIFGHRTTAQYPLRDWIVNLPNGSYSVNISVGESAYTDSNHVLDVNGVTVVDFDQENDNPDNLIYTQGTKLVEVTDGTLRLSLDPRGVNAKPNYIRIAPVNTSLLPPGITAQFDGLLFEENVYRGTVNVSLSAEDRSESGSIARLEYRLDDAAAVAYSTPFSITSPGAHTVIVDAEDENGNVSSKTYNFTIQEPTGALLFAENMTKIPGTDRAFPANDYYTFYDIGNPFTSGDAPNEAITHDSNTMRLNNTGTGTLVISEINISNPDNYSYTIASNNGEVSLPFSIAPGKFQDVIFKITATTTNGRSALFKETVSIVSNADNSGETTATLNGGFAPKPENGIEISAQQVFDSFGFTTSMRSIVNDDGTITPRNSDPTRPHSNYPLPANIDAGYEGDLVLSPAFVQADMSKPVIGLQLSALHGKGGADNAKFVKLNGTGTVGGIDFRTSKEYYQTLLPNRGSQLNSDKATTISEPFRIAIADYLTTGGNNINGNRPDLLGARVYKAKDRDGNIIPNEYIVLQDFIQNGCGAGSANCDWNDNTFYFINIRPQAEPTAQPIDDYALNVGAPFTYDVSSYFDKGYPGNKLAFKLTLEDGSEVPSWIHYDQNTLTFSGTAPKGAKQSYLIHVLATDLNGLTAESQVNFIVTDPSAFALRINAGGPSVEYGGKEFIKDIYFNGGSPYFNTKAALPELHTSERSDAKTFGYEVPVPNGYYTITLHFAEIYWGATGGGPGGTGKRVFDVNLEGDLILDDYDITADVGPGVPVSKTYEVNVTDGTLNLDLSSEASVGGVNFPMLSGLEIVDSALFNHPPKAIVSADVTNGNAPLTVSFTGSASSDDEGITSYLWDFGNGETSMEINPIYTYTEAGEYEVSLTVKDEEGQTATAKITITAVNDPPVAIASADVTEGKADLSVNFDGSQSTDDVEIASYLWNFGNGKTSEEVSPTFIYKAEGSYAVTLTVTDNKGLASISEPLTINVAPRNTIPVAVAQADVTSGTLPLTVQFTGSNSTDDSGVVRYEWDFDNGQTSSEANPQVSFDEEGKYNVILFVYDEEGAFDFDIIDINVGKQNSKPIAVIDGGPFSGDAPVFVEFVGSNSQDDKGVTDYLWDFGDGQTSTEQNPSHRYDIPGDYIVSLTVADAEGLSDGVQVLVRVNHVNAAPIAVANADVRSGASPLNVRFDGTGSTDDANTISYSWKLGNVVISSASAFNYRFDEPGSYNVELTVTDNEGLSDTDAITIDVDQANTAPVASISADRTTGKVPITVNFTGSGSQDDKGIVNYAYSVDGIQIASGPASGFQYQFTQVGIHTVKLTVTDAENATDAATIQISAQEPDVDPGTDFALRINAGGPEVIYDGKTFIADQNFKGGKSFTNTRVPLATLFKTERSAEPPVFGYDIPLKNGTYTVNLYFAEIYWGATGGGAGGTGKRIFDVNIENALLVDNLDINKEIGPQKVLVKSFDVIVTDGAMNIDFSALSSVGGVNQPKLSGIEILGKKAVNEAPNAVVSATPLQGIAPLQVSFIGSNSTDDKGVVDYLWTFKNGSTSVESDPKFTFAEAGNYTVNLQVKDAEGLQSTASVTINVSAPNAAPVAVASATPLTGTAPLRINFTGENSTDDNGVQGYLWSFGDGDTSTAINPEHVYKTEGVYNAMLKVTDAQGLTNSAVIKITVNAPVSPSDFALYLNTGSNDDLQFEGKIFEGDVSMPGIYNRSYVYVNNNASSTPLYKTERGTPADKLALNYAIPVPNGRYTVSTYHNELYWGKLGSGGPGKRVFDILIEGKLVKDNLDLFKESNNQPVKLSFEVNVTDGVLNIDMPASVNRPTISGLAIEAVVNQKPTAIATATPKTGTAPLVVNFDGSGSKDDQQVTGYLWEFEPGITSTLVKPNHTFNTAGTYPVTLTVTDAAGLSDKQTLTIEVRQAPIENDVALYINTGSGTDVSFENKTFVGDKNMSTIYNSNYTYANTNASSTPLYQSERGSEADKGRLNFSIPVPNGSYTVSTYHNEVWWGKGGNPAGPGKRVFDMSIEGSLVKDDLDFFKEFSNKPTKLTFTNIIVTDGILNINMKASVDRPSISGISIEGTSENEAPVAVITATPKTGAAPLETLFTGSGSTDDNGIANYFWDFNDGTTSTAANPKHIFTLAGNYDVTLKVTDAQGLSSTAHTSIVAQGCNAVPTPWTSADIGQVAATGSTCYQDGTFNVEASGADIWGDKDEFHFVYQKISGDVELIARVNSLVQTDVWAKAGVMIRSSLEDNAQHAYTMIAPSPNSVGGSGYAVQTRAETGGVTKTTVAKRVDSGLPVYLRLIRRGNTFSGYISNTKGNWQFIFSKTINMGTNVFVGLATTSHKDGALTSAVYDQVSVTGAQANIIAAAPLAGSAPLAVDFNGMSQRSKSDASLHYLWDFQDGETSKEVSPKHTFEKAGTYDVTLTVKEGKEVLYTSSVAIKVGADDTVSAFDNNEQEDLGISLYPNPASAQVNLEVKGILQDITWITIFDLRGREVLRIDAAKIKRGNNYPLDITSLQAGVYMLRITDQNGTLDQLRLVVKDQ